METEMRRLAMHIAEISFRFNIRLVLDPTMQPDKCGADPYKKIVVARPVTEETGYASILHEIGHIEHPSGVLRTGKLARRIDQMDNLIDAMRWINLSIVEEESAWEWARAHALYWSVAMQQTEALCFRTYKQMQERLTWRINQGK